MASLGPGNNKKAFAEINVTPLVDVMLVLLVIFMVTAPLMFNGINLSLPKTKKVSTLNLNNEKVILSIDVTGELYLGKEKILQGEVLNLLKEKLGRNASGNQDPVYIRAHENLKYGTLAKIMSFLKRGGINGISLVTEVEKGS